MGCHAMASRQFIHKVLLSFNRHAGYKKFIISIIFLLDAVLAWFYCCVLPSKEPPPLLNFYWKISLRISCKEDRLFFTWNLPSPRPSPSHLKTLIHHTCRLLRFTPFVVMFEHCAPFAFWFQFQTEIIRAEGC